MAATTYFTESQRFTSWIMWATLIAVDLIVLTGLIRTSLQGKGQGFTKVVMALVTVILIALTSLMFKIRLRTEINEEGIRAEFYPIDRANRFIPWDSVTSANLRHYDPIGEYAGWGIKGTGDNRALNIEGDEGLQLTMVNGKKLLIGTQKGKELQSAINRLILKGRIRSGQ